jgi:hypothetical protein
MKCWLSFFKKTMVHTLYTGKAEAGRSWVQSQSGQHNPKNEIAKTSFNDTFGKHAAKSTWLPKEATSGDEALGGSLPPNPKGAVDFQSRSWTPGSLRPPGELHHLLSSRYCAGASWNAHCRAEGGVTNSDLPPNTQTSSPGSPRLSASSSLSSRGVPPPAQRPPRHDQSGRSGEKQ